MALSLRPNTGNEGPMRAIDDLKTEHELIGRVLTILEAEVESIDRGKAPRPDMLSDALTFIPGFAARCHQGKEERPLFPALSEKSDAPRFGPERGASPPCRGDSGRRSRG